MSLTLFLGIIILTGICLTHVPSVDAHGDDHHRHPSPTPTPTQCMTPTETPEVTPTATPEASPTPSVTETDTSTTNDSSGSGTSSQPAGNSSTTNAPGAATCTISYAAPTIGTAIANADGTLTVTWFPSTAQGVQDQALVYGYAPDNMPYGVASLGVNTTNKTIGGLLPKQHVYWQIWALKDGCAEVSGTGDPVTQ